MGLPSWHSWWRSCLSVQETQETQDTGSTPGLGRSPGVGKGNPLWYSCRNGCRESDMTEHALAGWLAGWLAGCFMDEEIETHVKNLSRTTQLLSDWATVFSFFSFALLCFKTILFFFLRLFLKHLCPIFFQKFLKNYYISCPFLNWLKIFSL